MTGTATRELQDLVDDLARRHEVPGLAVGVLRDGREDVVTTGVTSTADPLPITPDTLFLVGSTTKTMTATALLAQVDAGALSLDDKVADLLPGLHLSDPAVLDVLTVQMLLNHTAGWRGDGFVDTGWGDDALERFVTQVLPDEPQVREPGTLVSYNNSAFLLAGRLLEVVTGREFCAAVRETVLEPLGMETTTFLPWEVAGRRTAIGHATTDGGLQPVPHWPLSRAMAPSGGAASSVLDQLRWAAYCLDGTTSGKPVLDEATRLLMQQPTAAARSTITGVGLSWLLQQRGDDRLVTHGGNVSNLQLGTFVLAPERGLAVTVLSNSRGGHEAGKELVDALLGPPPPALPSTSAPDDLAGRYDAGGWELHVTQEADRHFVQMVLPDGTPDVLRRAFQRPPTEVLHVGDDRLVTAARPWELAGDLGRAADGSVAWLRWGMRIAPRLTQ